MERRRSGDRGQRRAGGQLFERVLRGLDDHGEWHAHVAALQRRGDRTAELVAGRVRRPESAAGHQATPRRAGSRLSRESRQCGARPAVQWGAQRPLRRAALRRSNPGAIWASIIALFLGFAAVTQVHSQDVFSRSLNLETPSSLTTLIANLSETNNELRNEIFDVRRDVADAQDSVSSGRGTLTEAERQVAQLRVFSAQSAVAGP